MSTDNLVNIPTNPGNRETLEMLLWKMIELSGSDIFIMGNSPVYCRVGPQMIQLTQRKLTDQNVFEIANVIYGEQARVKLGAGKLIDTSYDIKNRVEDPNGSRTDLYRWRVNMVSCNRNSRLSATITMRSIPGTPPRSSDFDIPQEIKDVIMNTDQGMGLVVGPTGSGKTTLMAACLSDKLLEPESYRNLVTIEQPIEFVYDRLDLRDSFVTQMEVGRHIDSFTDGIENAMRMAPTDILLGESRSFETITAAIQGALTGHFLLSTLHANSVPETFQRIKSMFPESLQHTAIPETVQALKLCATQRLLPKIGGGRIAVREYLVLDQDVKNRLTRSANPTMEAFSLLEEFGQPMIADIEAKHQQGLISKEEFERQSYNYKAEREAMS